MKKGGRKTKKEEEKKSEHSFEGSASKLLAPLVTCWRHAESRKTLQKDAAVSKRSKKPAVSGDVCVGC
jgi:hypothetical protein